MPYSAWYDCSKSAKGTVCISFTAIRFNLKTIIDRENMPEFYIFDDCLFAWWCFIPLWTKCQLYRNGDQFYWRQNLQDPEKTTDLTQDPGKLYHIMLYTSHWSRFKLITSVVISTDYIGSWIVNPTTIWSRPWRNLKIIPQSIRLKKQSDCSKLHISSIW